ARTTLPGGAGRSRAGRPPRAGPELTRPLEAQPRRLALLRELAPAARAAVEHHPDLGIGLALGILLGLDAGDTRGLDRVLEFVVGEVDRFHGAKNCQRPAPSSIQYRTAPSTG